MNSKITTVLIISVMFSMLAFAPNSGAIDQDEKTVILEIDGVEYELVVDEKTTIQIEDKKHVVKVRVSPYSIFSNKILTFDYSSSMHFDLDESTEGIKIWSLDGNNALIMIQEYEMDIGLEDLLVGFMNEYKSMSAKTSIKKCEINGETQTLTGKKIHVLMGDIGLTQELYVVHNDGVTTALILQSMLTDLGNDTTEFKKMKNRIEQTIKTN